MNELNVEGLKARDLISLCMTEFTTERTMSEKIMGNSLVETVTFFHIREAMQERN